MQICTVGSGIIAHLLQCSARLHVDLLPGGGFDFGLQRENTVLGPNANIFWVEDLRAFGPSGLKTEAPKFEGFEAKGV